MQDRPVSQSGDGESPPSPEASPQRVAKDVSSDDGQGKRRAPTKRASSYRVQQRRISHRDAKADQNWRAPSIPDHPLVPAGEADLIESNEGVLAFAEHVREAGCFAYDTEFIGEVSYFPLLCVVQLATTERIALIDPLADIDLTPVWELIADPQLTTLVHAGAQDLEPVARCLNKPPANVFDTQIAAGFAHIRYPVGLADLVQETVGIELGKGLTFTSWDHRPLSARHRHYAADDVRYLPAVHAALLERLRALDRLSWADEECAAMLGMANFRFNADVQVARVKSGGMGGQPQQAALRALVALRDELARERDMPPRALVKDGVLIDIARKPPKNLQALRQIKGMPRQLKEHQGQRLLDALKQARAIPKDQLPAKVFVKNMPAQREPAQALWQRVVERCEQLQLSTPLVTSKKEVTRFHLETVGEVRGVSGVPSPKQTLLTGWRDQAIGDILREHAAAHAKAAPGA